jgi:spindle assembly checkpoint component MAD3
MSNILPAHSPTVAPMPPRPVLATSGLASSSGTTSSMRHDPLASSAARPAANARLQIFMDPTGSESSEIADTSPNAWTDLGTRKTRIKENVPEVKKLGGTTLKQAGRSKRVASGSGSSSSTSGAASSSKIIPYRDTAPADMAPPPVPAAKKGQDVVPRTPTKSQITPFVDGEESAGLGDVPSTPMFTPFRDEVSMLPFCPLGTEY